MVQSNEIQHFQGCYRSKTAGRAEHTISCSATIAVGLSEVLMVCISGA